ncbi:hypothetical protein ABB37_03411 [Leptomonas pyrrhocoris]|uniref:Uncharacterized protein n=1 Tax=Leptomonas pyrrhocoris TaxID=157538 RepID=A0A0N0DWW8_LEPPY|nr:hypothetical protein ABB37_03411 [Leptomonas pyrrhocoris]KPA82315.1 hypothetical protein ABB37_03411 [Leptomonas pyrrhocoris]|eukprot:XP_015660754.1 hypothetical protein ABB37_03411 [Leptomonas pyrrhocoris]
MQSPSPLQETASTLSGEAQSFATTNAGADGMSQYASVFIPSGFPKGGGGGAHPLPVPNALSSATAHAEAGGASIARSGPTGSSRSCNSSNGAGGSDGLSPAHTDSAAAAEWRALYGASAEMMAATAGAFRAGSSGVSFMTPIFHLTAHDATILSMEHNNHCKLLGISTSKNEILVTWTQLMPVIENMGALRAADDDLFGGDQAPPIDERLLEWDPATMSILIDEVPCACTELSWAPWQQGIYLAGLCPGHGIRIYHYSHGHWALDDCIRTTESTSCAISNHFTVACACSRGRVELWSRGAASGVGGPTPAAAPSTTARGHSGGIAGTGGRFNPGPGGNGNGSSWVLCRTVTFPLSEDEEASGGSAAGASRGQEGARNNGGGVGLLGATHAAPTTATRHRTRDIVGVGWDESGALLAVGDQGGSVHVLAVTQEGTRLGEMVFHLPPSDGAAPCRRVAWAPSSGRSFLSLAMVFGDCVRIVLFRRPRFMSAAGLPHPGHGGRNAAVASGNSSGGGGVSGATLLVLASAMVPCEEVTKLSWNGTGTRFVTSHLDSSVNIWAVDVRYQYPTVRPDGSAGGEPTSGDGAPQITGEGGRGSTALSEKRLSLVVSVRRTSSVHPYHAGSK